ncbi:four helix bundle suffix domain-containing protein [Patescibacteria group bacterium]|nr:four helix bundle suffix domain-containing protein [Patescibacteria group bacterium]
MAKAGFEYLLAYKITVPIYDYTVAFCNCYPPLAPNHPNFSNFSYPRLSSTRTYDQMIQSARSGMTNLAEGHQQQSLEGYIKLSGVNRASLEELLKDYLAFARQNHLEVWPKERSRREIREIGEIWGILTRTSTLPDNPNFPPLPNDPTKAANFMITLINQANYLQDRLNLALEDKFVKEGGFRENLFKKRMAYRNKKSPA